MCTVTFFPKDNQHWLLSTNRDELKIREKAIPPKIFQAGDLEYIAPIDGRAGGTWIGINSAGICMTLLNNYQGKNPLLNNRENTKSRGFIIPASMHLKNLEDVNTHIQMLDVHSYNPFKLLGIQCHPLGITEWNWDGETLQTQKLPIKPHLWISTGKDYDGVWMNRENVFTKFLKKYPFPDIEAVKELHSSRYPEIGAYSIAMEIDTVITVSNTIVTANNEKLSLLYHDGIPEATGEWSKKELTFKIPLR